MKLHLLNGYPFPFPTSISERASDEIADAASGVHLEIDGVTHFEWVHTVTIEFESRAACERAIELTGWNYWDEERMVLEAMTSAGDGYGHPAIVVRDKAYCGFTVLS